MLVTKVRDPSTGVATRVLTALGELAQVAGEDITKYLDQLLPMLIEALQVIAARTSVAACLKRMVLIKGGCTLLALLATLRTKARSPSARPPS